MGGPCVTCGAGIFDGGRQPFLNGVCYQCRLKDDPEAWTCVECGRLEADRWVPGVGAKLKARSLCHSCDLWADRVDEKDAPGVVVVNGQWYRYNPKQPMAGGDSSHLGHGGRKFYIQTSDGAVVKTNNLWCGGVIPAWFRDRLPNTAEFVAAPAEVAP